MDGQCERCGRYLYDGTMYVEIERLRTELKRANGDINKLCDMNRYLERLLRDARPCIDPARAGHSAALGTRDACNCILCELVSRERQKAALDKEEGK